MGNFDNTIDNRWRPDFESSRRRVHDEEREEMVHVSRELSFVPARRGQFEPYDAPTRALIRRITELQRLPHGQRVSELLEEWSLMDRMKAPEEKQRFLEPFIADVQRDPEGTEALLIFLMVAFEPVRRGISKRFEKLRSGLTPAAQDLNWSNREEARRLREIDRQAIYDITREAALEAVFGYPTPGPPKFFPWLRGTIAHRALDALASELPELETSGLLAAQAEAMQSALAGFESLEGPAMRDRRGMREWRQRIRMRDVFDVVEEFHSYDPVRDACATAIDRLPRRQREVLEGYFFDGKSIADIAAMREVSESTVYNQKATAQKTLHGDEVFFVALRALGQVRDRARLDHLAEAYPDGLYRDGRRIVVFPDAA